jgi:hypothetical protein
MPPNVLYFRKLSGKFLKVCFFIAALLFGGTLIIAGMNSYPGSKLLYLFFSVMFWGLIVTALSKRCHYGYLFLVLTLWLGFWAKISAHLILNYSYVEPIGRFDGSAEAWDQVLWVAIVAAAGVMLGKLLFYYWGKHYSRAVDVNAAHIPKWYPANRWWLLPSALFVLIVIAILNVVLGIHQIGMVPRTILLWPLNALLSWQIAIGNALLIAAILWWEIAFIKDISISVYALLLEGIVSTATLLSRGVYIFHTLPQLFALFENRQWLIKLSKLKIATLVFVSVGLMVVSISGVTTFRAYLYPHSGGFTTEEQTRLTRLEVLEGGIERVKILIAQGDHQEGHLRELLAEKAQLEKAVSKNQTEISALFNRETTDEVNSPHINSSSSTELLQNKDKLLHELQYQINTGGLTKILSLVVDRWIGLEGVMAVTSYPEKNPALLLEAAIEKREIGKSTRFQEICNSHYRWVDAGSWQFASLPGAAAFFYFSGSLWIVLFGMAGFAFLLQFSEQLVLTLTSNPLLCSLFGFTAANSIAQFGITPRQDIPFYCLIFAFVLFVSLIQSGRARDLMRKFVAILPKRI